MLTHANFAINIRDNGYDFTPDDVGLSFLPLCHVAERMADYTYFRSGTTVAYAESIDAVARNMMEVKPTVAVGVPRFFEKVHGRVMEKMGMRSIGLSLNDKGRPVPTMPSRAGSGERGRASCFLQTIGNARSAMASTALRRSKVHWDCDRMVRGPSARRPYTVRGQSSPTKAGL